MAFLVVSARSIDVERMVRHEVSLIVQDVKELASRSSKKIHGKMKSLAYLDEEECRHDSDGW